MTEANTTRDELVERITSQVLASLSGPGDAGTPGAQSEICANCTGACAAQCATRVRDVVAGGASRVEYHGQAADVPTDLARYIDHTLLRPDAVVADIDKLCAEAAEHRFAAVCVNPTWVRRAAEDLRDSDVGVASVVGFPFGATPTEIKVFEARRAIRDGAREIDMVINIGALLDKDEKAVAADIRAVRQACEKGTVLKVIIETCYLSDAQKRTACRIALSEGADFVKTSTGLGPGGATADDVKLMRRVVGPEMGVKAAGGIRDAATFWTMVRAGANRIGTSAAVAIMREISEGRTT
jgi:deoxyribose-phosphate aldolase